MESNLETKNTYSLPILEYSKLKWYLTLMGIVFSILFIGMAFIPVEEGIAQIFYSAGCFAFGIFFFYAIVAIHLFKIQYIKLTEETLEFKSPFARKVIKYNEIYTMNVYTYGNNTMLGIISNDKMIKLRKNQSSLLKRLFTSQYSFSIPINNFPNLELDKFYATIKSKIEEVDKISSVDLDEHLNTNEFENYANEDPGNLLMAILKSTVLTIIIGLIYGATLIIFKRNIIFIPILGTMAIIHTYSKNYKEEKINYFVRFLIGLICSWQIFIAVIVEIFVWNGLSINFQNFISVIGDYILYLIEEPMEQLIVILIALVCFYWGMFQGKTFRFQRSFNKIFMKKHGDFYYKRNERIVDIYINNPTDYDDQVEKFILEINEGCYIEKHKKNILGFLIPHKYVEEFSIQLNSNFLKLENEIYNEIKLGGTGQYKEHLLPCVIICNTNKEVELIRIQT